MSGNDNDVSKKGNNDRDKYDRDRYDRDKYDRDKYDRDDLSENGADKDNIDIINMYTMNEREKREKEYESCNSDKDKAPDADNGMKKAKKGTGRGRQIVSNFMKNRLALVGAVIIILIILTVIFAPFLAPYNPAEQNYDKLLEPPSREHLFGTDDLGRDLFSRVIYGSRYTLLVGVGVVAIVAFVGSTLGFMAGYYGGLIDNLIMRVVDVMLAVPALVLALAIAGALGGGLLNVIIAIGAVGWTQFARLVRGEVLTIKELDYIQSARSIGANDLKIIVHHVLPNMIAPIIVYTTLYVPSAILWAASLSFLGLGVQPPYPEWGALIANGRSYLSFAWWIATIPGLAIMLTVLGFNFLGDGLRDALDPKMGREL